MTKESVDHGLENTCTKLQNVLGSNFTKYSSLIEAFISGRLTKEEHEISLRSLLEEKVENYDLHNKYIGLVLEKVAAVEASVLQKLQPVDVDDLRKPPHVESLSLFIKDLPWDDVDEKIISEATSREFPACPFDDDGDGTMRMVEEELIRGEKSFGRPLSEFETCGTLPNSITIQMILSCWLRGYNLEVSSIEPDHITSIQHTLHEYLAMIVRKAGSIVSPDAMEGGKMVLTMAEMRQSAQLDNFPSPIIDALFFEYS